MSKPREFWIDPECTEETGYENITRYTWTEDAAHVGTIHVIEKSAYTKAVKALTIIETMSEDELAVKTAHEALKELGESE